MIQLTSDAAVHVHSAGAPTFIEPVPPAAPRDIWGVDDDTAHLTGDGDVVVDDDEPHAAVATATDVTSSISSRLNGAPA